MLYVVRLIGAQMIDEITKEDFINVYSLNGKVVQMIDKICCHATRVIITGTDPSIARYYLINFKRQMTVLCGFVRT
jgi:hypothetical protein